MRTNGIMAAAVGVIALVILAGMARADIVADFTGGNGTTQVDQYAGKAGDGWSGAWVENSSTDISATVINTSPLNGGGNYLSVTNNDTGTSTSGDCVGRRYTDFGSVVLTAPHTISFDFRLDTPTSQILGSGDQLIFVNARGTVLGGDNGYGIWTVPVSGALKWGWRNGNNGVTSTMDVVTGTVYHFTIDLDPAAHKYEVTISNGTTSVSSGLVGYRNTSYTYLDYIDFFSKDVNLPSDPITFSLDNLRIVPEPATAALLACAAAAGLLRRREARR